MASSVTALRNILKREEALLLKLKEALSLMSHLDTKALMREMMNTKRADIRQYKKILKQSTKCPAVQKKTR